MMAYSKKKWNFSLNFSFLTYPPNINAPINFRTKTYCRPIRGNGHVVSVLPFNSDDPSPKPLKSNIKFFERKETKQKVTH